MCKFGNFSILLASENVHIFPKYAYQYQKRYLRQYFRKTEKMKVGTFTARLAKLNNYFFYYTPDCMGKMVIALPNNKFVEVENDRARV